MNKVIEITLKPDNWEKVNNERFAYKQRIDHPEIRDIPCYVSLSDETPNDKVEEIERVILSGNVITSDGYITFNTNSTYHEDIHIILIFKD